MVRNGTGSADDVTDAKAEASPETAARNERLLEALLAGEHRALARVISLIEDRAPGHRDLVSRLHGHTGGADVVGITGSPGAGKSTLVDKLAEAYRARGDTVGVVAVDPASPYSGGSVLGDRIRMASTVGDMDVFFRSMSARGRLGGISNATADAVKALDAFGKDVVVVETVGAGQSEVDIVRTADTVAVLVQPGSGDDVQMLKAGILEIGDVFVVNKADMDGTERTVAELQEMIRERDADVSRVPPGHHGGIGLGDGSDSAASAAETDEQDGTDGGNQTDGQTRTDGRNQSGGQTRTDDWEPTVVETVATAGEGIDDLVAAFDAHADYLRQTGLREERALSRYAEEVRRLVRADANELLEAEIGRRGGMDSIARRIRDRETDPYAVAASIVDPLRECLRGKRAEGEDATPPDSSAGEDREAE
ncbi:methylmalonyl Co-A mutase-associated GTPase MeaB [Halobellus ordinarius]|uniref:methylmalonyl Co-A mutase-associated GTPase MeaB n=1 Tax=Halobellus ordinarius TaxID=3075120 RepID=UPI0028806090|nr:methylmalonyl Co-A mutase-associated GTPase MeaB [Halobellus sp. ZY16]